MIIEKLKKERAKLTKKIEAIDKRIEKLETPKPMDSNIK